MTSAAAPFPATLDQSSAGFANLLARLPEEREWYTPADVASLFGLTPGAVRYHLRCLAKRTENSSVSSCLRRDGDKREEIRLDLETTTRLIKSIYQVSHRVNHNSSPSRWKHSRSRRDRTRPGSRHSAKSSR